MDFNEGGRDPMIEARDLVKRYGDLVALDLPEFSVPRGESFGLVGNNGAGKTTFFSLILDLIEATAGEVLSNGRNVRQSEHWKGYTGSYLDERFLIDFLTPEEYFQFIGGLHDLSREDLENFYLRFDAFFNDEILGKAKLLRELSRGNQKKVGIAAAFLGNAEVVVLDEPFPHLDPSSVNRLKKLLSELQRERHLTMLISSHSLNHVTDVCSRLAILEKGHIIHDMPKSEDTLSVLETYFAV